MLLPAAVSSSATQTAHKCALQVLQRPGHFNVRQFHFAVQKLHASTTPGIPEPLKTGVGGHACIETEAREYLFE